jgi:protein translocase SEC61 complex gamma subunit
MKNITVQTKSFFLKCKRVWQTLRKPSKKEFEMTTKVSLIGILVLGVIGFLIALIMKLFVK